MIFTILREYRLTFTGQKQIYTPIKNNIYMNIYIVFDWCVQIKIYFFFALQNQTIIKNAPHKSGRMV